MMSKYYVLACAYVVCECCGVCVFHYRHEKHQTSSRIVHASNMISTRTKDSRA